MRQADDLPLEEIGNAVVTILTHHVSAPLDEVIRETARLFGIRSVRHVVEARMRRAVHLLRTRGRAALEGDSISLAETAE
jgi:hypothetical protein